MPKPGSMIAEVLSGGADDDYDVGKSAKEMYAQELADILGLKGDKADRAVELLCKLVYMAAEDEGGLTITVGR